MILAPEDVRLCVSGGSSGPGELDPGDGGATSSPMSPPIVQTSLFAFPSFQDLLDGFASDHRSHVYSRGVNPTREAVEATLADLEGGGACTCFSSGMAAVSALMLGLLKQGDHVLFVNDTYGPTVQLARRLARFGVEHDVLRDLDVDAVGRAIRPDTRLVWMESPGTMLFRVLDVEAVAGLARERGALSCLDNSWATPLLQKPLAMGVDFVVHSATKYLAGHSDTMAGAVVSTAERMQELFYRSSLLLGGMLAPFDAWLLQRGMRSLPVRLRQHEEDALRVALFLSSHPAVTRVHHPALFDDRELVDRQLRGYSGVFSFELSGGDFAAVKTFIDRLEHFRIGVSWGGVESLVLSPERNDDGARLAAWGLPRGLVRLSVGLEGSDLLIEDLDRALGGSASGETRGSLCEPGNGMLDPDRSGRVNWDCGLKHFRSFARSVECEAGSYRPKGLEMKNRIAALPGTPRRIRLSVPWNVEDKIDLPAGDSADIIPSLVRIEVAGGLNSTRSAMRAARVQQALEHVGATGHTVELEGEHATLAAEADRKQVLHVARLPFVRRVSAC